MYTVHCTHCTLSSLLTTNARINVLNPTRNSYTKNSARKFCSENPARSSRC